MRTYAFLLVAPLSLSVLAACGGNTENAANPDGGTTLDDSTVSDDAGPRTPLPCGVESVIERNCVKCHGSTPKFGAPMSLTSHEAVHLRTPGDASKEVWQEMQRRVHLPATDADRMPQKPNAPLSAADLAVLDEWFAGGASARTGACSDPIPDAGDTDAYTKPLSCTPDMKLLPSAKYAMPKDKKDIYICYGVDLPVSAKRHITGIAPRIANDKIVHHMLLMQSTKTVSPVPHACTDAEIVGYRMLYGWAPGVKGYELPAAAGLPADAPTTHWVVQIHYNNLNALVGESDDSGFDLCSTDQLRPNDADVAAFGSLKFTIPPKAKHDITATWLVPGSVPEIHVLGAFPHMHGLGRYISTSLTKAGSTTPIDLGTDVGFDFNTQFFAELPDTVIKPGDTVKTRCKWENTTDQAVSWGEDTADEMCYSFTLYYPKINTPLWRWMMPAYLAETTVNAP